MYAGKPRGARRRICIVGGTHIANTPRVLKEADALHEAGFDVRVVFSQSDGGEKARQDADLLRSRGWRATAVSWSRYGHSIRWGITGVRQLAFQRLPRHSWPWGQIAERAEGRVFPELAAAAAKEEADLYIGHYVEGLAAAAAAAKRHAAPYGFDAEDFHADEGNSEMQSKRSDFIQRRYLHGCAHITASSQGIAESLSNHYAIEQPVAIHNTFPWKERAQLDGRVLDRRGPELSLYWYSQNIGLDRGIQDAIRAAGLLGGPVQIHLRGTVTDLVRAELIGLANSCGVADRLVFHPQVPPNELLSRACEHDVGLALEQGGTLNRAICASNKMFFYLLAGLAVAATNVAGQRIVLDELPQAARLYQPGDAASLAQCLEHWRRNPKSLAAAKAASLEAARAKWNWESESSKLVAVVEAVTGPFMHKRAELALR